MSQLEPEPNEIQKQKLRATGVVWAVFLAALVATLSLRWVASLAASSEITAETNAIVALADGGMNTAREIADKRTEALYATTDDRNAIDNYRPFVRALAHEVLSMSQDDRKALPPDSNWRLALDRFWSTLLIIFVAQTIIILLFPTMYHIRATNAVSHITRMAQNVPPDRRRLSRNFWNKVWLHRHRRFLHEEGGHSLLWRRLGFAALMGLSSMYLLAPTGLAASLVGEFARLHAAPGSPSYPFWFTSFSQASPFVIGLSGYLLYSLTVFFQRAMINDVSHRLFTSLWNRGIIVVVLSLALTGIDEGSNFSRAMVFVAGVFPQTGIQAIGKLAQAGMTQLGRLQPRGFGELPEVGLMMETALQELGVTSTIELANTDLDWLINASGVDPRSLASAADRALLYMYFVPDQIKALSNVPVSSGSELVLWAEGADCYAESERYFNAQGITIRELADRFDDPKKADRRANLCQILGVSDLDLQLREIGAHRNVRFVIDNKLVYKDL